MSRAAHLAILGFTALVFFLPITAFFSLIDYYLDALTGELIPGKPLPALTEQLLRFQDHALTTEFATQPFSIAVTATYIFLGFLLLTTAALTAILIPFVTGAGRLWLDDGPVLADHEKLIRNSVIGYIFILTVICILRFRAISKRNS